jgi:membrane protein YdbS with pleckstrin-like domain
MCRSESLNNRPAPGLGDSASSIASRTLVGVLAFISLIVATSQFPISVRQQSFTTHTEVNWPHIAAVVIVVVVIVGLSLYLLRRRRTKTEL